MTVAKVKKYDRPKSVVKTTDKYEWENCTYPTLPELLDDADGFYVDVDDEQDICIDVKYKDSSSGIICKFNMIQFEHCCGMREIGDLSNKTLNDKDMDTLFSKIFDEIDNRTIAITTIKSQTEWEKWLNKTKLFQAVKSFVNGTRNTVTLWVSTN